MTTPWFFTVRPFVLPSDGRDELRMIAVGMTDEQFQDKIWDMRKEASGFVGPSGNGWPKTCRAPDRPYGMFILPRPNANVTTLKKMGAGR